MATQWIDWVTTMCPECGQPAPVVNGALGPHTAWDSTQDCSASFRIARYEMPPRWQRFKCPDCDTSTMSDRATGDVRRHRRSWSDDECVGSDTQIGPIGATAEAELVPGTGGMNDWDRPRYSGDDGDGFAGDPTTSVRTVGGGLPSLGKKRK